MSPVKFAHRPLGKSATKKLYPFANLNPERHASQRKSASPGLRKTAVWSTKKHVCLFQLKSALKFRHQSVGLYPGKNVQRKNTKFARPSQPRIAKRYASANRAQYAFLDLLPEPLRIGDDCDSHLFYNF